MRHALQYLKYLIHENGNLLHNTFYQTIINLVFLIILRGKKYEIRYQGIIHISGKIFFKLSIFFNIKCFLLIK